MPIPEDVTPLGFDESPRSHAEHHNQLAAQVNAGGGGGVTEPIVTSTPITASDGDADGKVRIGTENFYCGVLIDDSGSGVFLRLGGFGILDLGAVDPESDAEYGALRIRNGDLQVLGLGGAAADIYAQGKVVAEGGIGVGNSAAASTPGTVVKKMEVFDASGQSLGFVAIYNAIT